MPQLERLRRPPQLRRVLEAAGWFPAIDRNPQTFVPNIFEAKEADYQPATHTIHRSTRYRSRIELPVAPR